jgi:hypothetical protein
MAEVLAPLSDSQLRDLIVAFGHLEHLVGPADVDSRAESDVAHSMTMHEEEVVSGIE